VFKNNFWKNKKIFITGHTGFKGTWLSFWLKLLGANVTGYSLKPNSKPSFFQLINLKSIIDKNYIENILDIKKLEYAINKSNCSILFHLAAQPNVRYSYKNPIETIDTNILGTRNILEIIKSNKKIRSVVIITTDKVYKNTEAKKYFKENDKLGGNDIYSASKACCEIIVDAYRKSFFKENNIRVATARSGNVIGGGDWTTDRLVPDCLNSFFKNKKLTIRYPKSIRPWQHVLEPLYGYLLLAEKLFGKDGIKYIGGWNFGPNKKNNISVLKLAELLKKNTKSKSKIAFSKYSTLSESKYLHLNSEKSKKNLNWNNYLDLNNTLYLTVDWYQNYLNKKKIEDKTRSQIKYFENIINEKTKIRDYKKKK